MSAALKAIEDVCAAGGDPTDRRAVRNAVFNNVDFDGASCTWSLDSHGDTTLTDMTFYQVSQGHFQITAVSLANKITALK